MRPVPGFLLLVLGVLVFTCLLFLDGRNAYLHEVLAQAEPWKISWDFSVWKITGAVLISILSAAPPFIIRTRPRASWIVFGIGVLAALPIMLEAKAWGGYMNWSRSGENYLSYSIMLSLFGFILSFVISAVWRRETTNALQ